MLKQIATLALGGILLAGVSSCNNNNGLKRTDAGLMYKIVKDAEGEKHPKIGDIIEVHLKVKVRDSILNDTRMMMGGSPYTMPLQEDPFKGSFTYGLQLLTPGDSAVFYILLDSLKKYQPEGAQYPEWFKDDDTLVYETVLVNVKTREEMDQEQQAKNAEQLKKDDEQLQAYFKDKGISPEKTASGLYYTIDKQGSGDKIEPKNYVSVKYTGTNLAGVAFDSNVDPKFQHVEPFSFVAGQGQVIKGWDEGILLLQKGSKAHFYIPSALAYGGQALSAEVGPYSCLVFEVEITDVQKDLPQQNQ
ncbi:MAG: FKBP-type peptidyl-prolyl cis-trans isomerase [Flavipsychrobacter sp.]